MIHLPNTTDLQELRRVLELIQRTQPVLGPPSSTQSARAPKVSGGVSGSGASGSGGSGGVGTAGAAGADGADGSSASLMVGSMAIPEVLLSSTGSVLTDEFGYALIGVHIESIVLTGAGDTIQAMGV